MIIDRTNMGGGIQKFVLAVIFFVSVHSAYIVDDSNGLGRAFDGIGGLSGGGVSYH